MAILSMEDILKDEDQSFLGGSEAVLVKTIMDMTSKTRIGANTVTLPRVSGLVLKDIATGGTRQTGGGMTHVGDQLLLNQNKEVPEFLAWSDEIDSNVDLERSFLDAAPRVFGQGLEVIIATQLATASAGDFNSGILNSFTVANIANAKKVLDLAKIPLSERFLACNADSMEILAGFQEFEDGSKSLSDEALRQGIISQIKGFNVVQSEDVSSTELHCYHKTAVAFAMHAKMSLVSEVMPSYAQKFIALRGKYGAKVLDAGVRKLTITLAV